MKAEADSTPGERPDSKYRMKLFLVGDETNSRLARENLAKLCNGRLGGCCEVEYVDVLEDYASALEHNILVMPALLVLEPVRALVIGNLSDAGAVDAVLGL